MSGRVRVYMDFTDWWVGLYIGPHHLYFCPLPCVVVRIRRRTPQPVVGQRVTFSTVDETHNLNHKQDGPEWMTVGEAQGCIGIAEQRLTPEQASDLIARFTEKWKGGENNE